MHHFLILLMTGLFLTGCNDKQTTEHLLKSTCKKLSKETGNDYEPIIGRYLEKKSYGSIESPGGQVAIFSSVIVFAKNNEEPKMYSGEMTETEFYGQYRPVLEKIIFSNLKRAESDQYVYGVCAYNTPSNQYQHEISTLMLIEGR